MEFYYGNVVLLTGASSGIGKLTAEYLAELGCKVYGTSRKGENGTIVFPNDSSTNSKQATLKGFVKMVQLDVCNDLSVKDAVDYVIQQESRIDVLINNAGFGISGAIEETSEKEAFSQFDTNFFGMHRMCRKVLPIMRKQRKGLIINIGSVAGTFSIPYQSMYSASKSAMKSFTEALRMEVREFGIRAVVIEPGDTQTGFTDNRYYSQESESTSYPKGKASIEKMIKDERNGDRPIGVAKTIGKLLNAKNPPSRVTIGMVYKVFTQLKRVLPSRLVEFILGKMYG
ncbi:MAG: SDR family NAD(P)-dependent oxidoreductase [Clostridiales bacterium]|nr:SDR family NAD(P)-dependent oxidoreductase [Clostridiales bacterium]